MTTYDDIAARLLPTQYRWNRREERWEHHYSGEWEPSIPLEGSDEYEGNEIVSRCNWAGLVESEEAP